MAPSYTQYINPAAAPLPTLPVYNNLDEVGAAVTKDYNNAVTQVTPQFDNSASIAGLADAAKQMVSRAQDKAAAIRGEAPSIGAIYDTLAKQLTLNQGAETKQKNQERLSTLGSQATNAASQGFDTSTGFEAAQGRQTDKSFDDQIGAIADKFGVQQEHLAAEHEKDIKTLEAEAQDALSTGDKQSADIIYQIAGLKQQQQALISDAAYKLMGANNAKEQQYWQNYYADLNHQLQVQQLGLEAQRVRIEQQNASTAAANSGTSLTIVPITQADGSIKYMNYNPKTGQYTDSGQVGNTVPKYSQNDIASAANAIAGGSMKLSDVPINYRGQVDQLAQSIKKQKSYNVPFLGGINQLFGTSFGT